MLFIATGGIGSGVGSAIGAHAKAAGWSQSGRNLAMIGGAGLSGGIGSSISGGSFWEGFGFGATVAAVNHVAHELTDPHSQFKHWEKTDGVNLGLVGEGLFNLVTGGYMMNFGYGLMLTGKGALPGAGLFIYGSTQIGFGIAQITRGLQGYRAKSPMNLPGAIDYGLGGSGVTGTAIDAMINIANSGSRIEQAIHLARFLDYLYNIQAVNGYRSSIYSPNVNHMPQDNVRTYLILPDYGDIGRP